MILIDSHCHLHFEQLNKREDKILANMRNAGVAAAVSVCTQIAEIPELARLSDAHSELFHTVGVHPCSLGENANDDGRPGEGNNDSEQQSKSSALLLAEIALSHKKTVAIGETGLDYSRAGPDARTFQEPSFQEHIEAALDTKLPLIVHTRQSIDDAIEILRPAAKRGLKAVLHCFSGTWKQATDAWDAGLLLSFTGIVTFKNAADVLSVAARAPHDSFMVETDSPYLAPEPHRGKLNEPAHVALVAHRIANVRKTSLAALAEATTSTCARFYNLPLSKLAAQHAEKLPRTERRPN